MLLCHWRSKVILLVISRIVMDRRMELSKKKVDVIKEFIHNLNFYETKILT